MDDDEATIILKTLDCAPTKRNLEWAKRNFGPAELAVCSEFFRGGGTLTVEQLVWFARVRQNGGRVPVGLAYETLDLLVRGIDAPPDSAPFRNSPLRS